MSVVALVLFAGAPPPPGMAFAFGGAFIAYFVYRIGKEERSVKPGDLIPAFIGCLMGAGLVLIGILELFQH